MMSKTLVREHRTHQYHIGTQASGFVGAGGTATYRWDGEHWEPVGRSDAALYLGPLTDTDLRAALSPDYATLLSLGPHWAEHGTRQFTYEMGED